MNTQQHTTTHKCHLNLLPSVKQQVEFLEQVGGKDFEEDLVILREKLVDLEGELSFKRANPSPDLAQKGMQER